MAIHSIHCSTHGIMNFEFFDYLNGQALTTTLATTPPSSSSPWSLSVYDSTSIESWQPHRPASAALCLVFIAGSTSNKRSLITCFSSFLFVYLLLLFVSGYSCVFGVLLSYPPALISLTRPSCHAMPAAAEVATCSA